MTRLAGAWRVLGREQRLAALAALGLFVSMLLPWYSKTNTFVEHNAAKASQASFSAFQAFSFVEAAVLLVSAGVLAMLFARAEGRDFQLPGGDGMIVMIAGGWAALLIFYRLLDKPGLQGTQKITATVGVEWGIFIALLLALGLVYTGRRIRAGERGQPPLARPRQRAHRPDPDPDRDETVVRFADDDRRGSRSPADERGRPAAVSPVPARPLAAEAPRPSAPSPRPSSPEPRPARGRPRFPPAPSEQMSFEDAPPKEE
jgi:hypothetical protein